MDPILRLDDYCVRFGSDRIVEDVTFSLQPGEVLGLVGESGSGKTTIALGLLGHRPWGATVGGRVMLGDHDMLAAPPPLLQRLRGRRIAYVPQNPTTALNPARRVGALLAEQIMVHGAARDRHAARSMAAAALCEVGLADAERILKSYPHQLSGGQQQRVVLALATLCDPDVLVLDEPTTGLDVTSQAVVITFLRAMRDRRRLAMVYVTHDLDLLAGIATRLAVLYAGRVVETGPAGTVFGHPRHPYTQGLLAATPSLRRQMSIPVGLPGMFRRDQSAKGCAFAPRCPRATVECSAAVPPMVEIAPGHAAACLHPAGAAASVQPAVPPRAAASCAENAVLTVTDLSITYPTARLMGRSRAKAAPALAAVSFDLHKGEILAVVGESGSGKSTLAKAVAGLLPAFAGELGLQGTTLAKAIESRTAGQRQNIQFVFQNPDASLNPRRRVTQILSDALRAVRPGLSGADRDAVIARALAEVRLPPGHADRYPDQLSGGERQRVAIARALVADPQVLICDEVLSALDVSVQAGIIALLKGLCRQRNMAILFISHDLPVVRSMADRVIVLYRGTVMAALSASGMLEPPFHPYVHLLLSTASGAPPTLSADTHGGDNGCPFVSHCTVQIPGLCDVVPPPWVPGEPQMRCHRSADTLTDLLRLESSA